MIAGFIFVPGWQYRAGTYLIDGFSNRIETDQVAHREFHMACKMHELAVFESEIQLLACG